MSHLPKAITIQSTRGVQMECEVFDLGATDVPTNEVTHGYDRRLNYAPEWDGHTMDTAKHDLATWVLPERVREIAERVERILEDGVPDQRRSMLRNQEDGMLDDYWVTDIALGEEVDRPFNRWTRQKRGETRVAICLDATGAAGFTAEVMAARCAMAAGMASALEGLDYDVQVVAATMIGPPDHRRPKALLEVGHPRYYTTTRINATSIKREDEPFVSSAFAHFADTGMTRMVRCWIRDGNGCATHLTNDEWRSMVDADLFVYIGAGGETGLKRVYNKFKKQSGYYWDSRLQIRRKRQPVPVKTYPDSTINLGALPDNTPLGPVGDDTIRLEVCGISDIDPAIERLEAFFEALDE